MLVRLAQDAEGIGDLRRDVIGVVGDLVGVLAVVVARAAGARAAARLDVGGEAVGHEVGAGAVFLHDVGHMVAHQRREPLGLGDAGLLVADPDRCCREHPVAPHVASRGLARRLGLTAEPFAEAHVGKLDDEPVADLACGLERLRPIGREPDRHGVACDPVHVDGLRAVRVLHGIARHHLAHRIAELGGIGERRRRLAHDPHGAVAATDGDVEAPAADIAQRREEAPRHRPVAHLGVGHQRPEAHPLGMRHADRNLGVAVGPEDVGIEEPDIVEARRLALARDRDGALDPYVALEGNPELHALSPLRSAHD